MRRGVTGDYCVGGGAELANMDGIGRGGFELGLARLKGGHLYGVGEG